MEDYTFSLIPTTSQTFSKHTLYAKDTATSAVSMAKKIKLYNLLITRNTFKKQKYMQNKTKEIEKIYYISSEFIKAGLAINTI